MGTKRKKKNMEGGPLGLGGGDEKSRLYLAWDHLMVRQEKGVGGQEGKRRRTALADIRNKENAII